MAVITSENRSWIKRLILDLKMYWKILVVILVPVIFSPLPILIRTSASSCAYVVLIMVVYWLTEVFPLCVTALFPLALFPLFGIMTADEVSKIYTKDSIWLFFGSLVVAVAVEQSQLHHRLGLFTLTKIGSSPRRLMLGFMVSTCFLSMWMSNTATTAMMVPLALAVIEELIAVESAAKTSSCNAAAATNGVFVTDISLSTDAIKALDGQDELNSKAPHTSIAESIKGHQSPRFRRMCKGLLLSICYSANIGGTGTLTGTGTNLVLLDQLDKLSKGNQTGITFAKWMAFAVPQMIIILILAWFWLQAVYIGFGGRTKKQAAETAAIRSVLNRKYGELTPISYKEKATLVLFTILVLLWILRDPEFIPGWGYFFPKGVKDSTAAMVVTLLFFIVPSQPPNLNFSRKRPTAIEKSPQALLTWNTMQHEFPWGILLLIGGSYAMAEGVKASELDKSIGQGLEKLDSMPNFAFVAISVVMVTFITEFCSNTAIAAVVIPIGYAAAEHMDIHPLYVTLPITIACSFAFMLPVATPPNAIIFSTGLMRVADMVLAGFVMNIICMVVLLVNVNTYGCWVFQCHTDPRWRFAENASLHSEIL